MPPCSCRRDGCRAVRAHPQRAPRRSKYHWRRRRHGCGAGRTDLAHGGPPWRAGASGRAARRRRGTGGSRERYSRRRRSAAAMVRGRASAAHHGRERPSGSRGDAASGRRRPLRAPLTARHQRHRAHDYQGGSARGPRGPTCLLCARRALPGAAPAPAGAGLVRYRAQGCVHRRRARCTVFAAALVSRCVGARRRRGGFWRRRSCAAAAGRATARAALCPYGAAAHGGAHARDVRAGRLLCAVG
mmetsp:Transcript_21607/g.66867  ORF Transcript_21607/g.66867 Transcript_21607/m.66867 type:complete len:244 (+) Transcript_21607:1269-2000(+)